MGETIEGECKRVFEQASGVLLRNDDVGPRFLIDLDQSIDFVGASSTVTHIIMKAGVSESEAKGFKAGDRVEADVYFESQSELVSAGNLRRITYG